MGPSEAAFFAILKVATRIIALLGLWELDYLLLVFLSKA